MGTQARDRKAGLPSRPGRMGFALFAPTCPRHKGARAMLAILTDRTFRHLFAAQVVALLGTGLATVALGLLAWNLAGERAGDALGTILAIKMIAYVGVAPVAGALAERLPRRAMLVALDLVRATTALALPFVTTLWQVYGLVFVLQAASAAFTPTFQAAIPDVLPDEARYTRALSLSRLAYDLESIASPMLAAALLSLISGPTLFFGTVAGFCGSAALIVSVVLPIRPALAVQSFGDRLTRGLRRYLATPRLRGLLALNLAAAAGGAMVIVNTVVMVRTGLGLSERAVAVALGAFGGGSMLAALALPRVLERTGDRSVMMAGAGAVAGALLALAATTAVAGPGWLALLAAWAVIGLGSAAILTPAGRLLRRSSGAAERPALFAAQFALSHAAWLVTYPLAGRTMTALGPVAALGVMASLAVAGLMAARLVWPAGAAAAGDAPGA